MQEIYETAKDLFVFVDWSESNFVFQNEGSNQENQHENKMMMPKRCACLKLASYPQQTNKE
ncbi:hypothetical protein JCM10914A_46090 [Paenibacillus sp. JCM 10914]